MKDAKSITARLQSKDMGFKVQQVLNANQKTMRTAMDKFANDVQREPGMILKV